jgi:hypothetical protein
MIFVAVPSLLEMVISRAGNEVVLKAKILIIPVFQPENCHYAGSTR